MLEQVHFDEAKQSQLTFVELLLAMGYQYISSEEALRQRGHDTSRFILKDIAAQKLMEINSYELDGKAYKFSEKDVRDAIDDLENIQYEGLIDTSQKIYNMIMPTSGGKTITVHHNGKKMSQNFRFIDFEHPENNAFHVTVEYRASGKDTIRPDIVIFVNGIPFVIVENKKSSIAIEKGIQQMNRNQGPEYCPRLFTYTQMLIATNGKVLKYGTTDTKAKFYAVWKEKGLRNESPDEIAHHVDQKIQSLISKQIEAEVYKQLLEDLPGWTTHHTQRLERLATEQDRGVVCLLEPTRLLDLTKNHILFEGGVKKLSRYQQYFAIRKMLQQIEQLQTTDAGITRRLGGLMWHTQGSGKSLTMVLFVKALIEDPSITNPRVIIVTDRKDLDKQIRDTFKNCNLKKTVTKATNGQHLLDLIESKSLDVITTVIDKFQSARKKNVNFVDKDPNIFVLIDEAHRSQGGEKNIDMNRIIPNACYIGFTGTPLMKDEIASWKKFGGYIDKYTIDDALTDKIILPLIYEGRYVELEQNEEQVDKHMDRLTVSLNDKNRKSVEEYATSKIILNNPQRINEIAYDIEKHYIKHFKGTGLKAQIVAPSKYSAILFQEYFEKTNHISTAVVISDEHDYGDEHDAHKVTVNNYLYGIRSKHASLEKYEKDVIDSFKYQDAGVEIIIVVDKLLTGFDAPRNTVLYLAKDLHDHGLLQAIARVNRLFENNKLPKTSGYIIDYSENAKNIKTAMKLFGNFDEEDVKGTLIDVEEKIAELEQSYAKVQDIFKEIKTSKDDEAYLQFLNDNARRDLFYKALNEFIKNLNECYVLQDFVHEFKQLDMYTSDLKKLLELRKAASLKYADSVDLAEYKRSLVDILDKYVDARGVELLTKQINITDRENFEKAVAELGTYKSKAEAIAAQTERTITEKYETDPEFYDRFSKKISHVLEEMRLGKLADIEALEQLKLISDDVLHKKDEALPEAIKQHPGSDVFYRNLKDNFNKQTLPEDEYINIITELFTIIKAEAIVDWYKNADVKRKIMNIIDDYLYDVVKTEKKRELSTDEIKTIIAQVIQLAENNHELF